jgi:drug/metabolite transporter (DMT)-like permease
VRAVTGPRPWLQVLAFGAVYVIWGSTYLAIRIGVATLPPFLMAGTRFLSAGLILYSLLRLRGVTPARPSHWVHSGLAGFMLLTLGNGLVSWAEEAMASNFAALLIAAVPLHMALLDWLRPGGQRPAVKVFAGIALGSVGMLFLVAPDPSALTAPAPLGVAALLAAGLCWAGGTLYARYSAHHPHPLMSAAQQMIVGGLVLLLAAVVHGDPARLALATVSWQSVSALLYLIVFGSLVAFSAYGWLVVVSTPARLSTIAYVNPVVAVVLGWLVLGEVLTPRAIAGGALILAAVTLMTTGVRPWRRGRDLALPGARQPAPASAPHEP